MVKKVTSTQAFIELASFTGPGLPPKVVGSFDSFQEADYDQVYNKTFENERRGLTVRFSQKVWQDNQYPSIVKGYAKNLRTTFHIQREIDIADRFMNDADDATNNPGPDGVAFGSAAHPLDPGKGTFSNILSPAETVSPSALNKLTTILRKQKSNKGFNYTSSGPFTIWCSVDKEVIWNQIKMGIQEEFGTPDRNVGAPYARMIGGIVANPHFDNAERFAVIAPGHRMWVWDRELFDITPLEMKTENKSLVCSATSRRATNEFDWRDTAYSFA